MSTSTKKISINPNLFSSQKTSKKREMGQSVKPLISPNILKNKLMNRIQQFKKTESEEMKRKELPPSPQVEIGKYTDDFQSSLDYLQNLSQINKFKKEKQKQQNKTWKNRTGTGGTGGTGIEYHAPHVELDLPEALREPIPRPLVTIQHQNNNNNNNPIQLQQQYKSHSGSGFGSSYSVDNVVPYGVLKGGLKPTFRQWTQKVRPEIPKSFHQPMSEREKKLQQLKEKFKQESSFPVPRPQHPHPQPQPQLQLQSQQPQLQSQQPQQQPMVKKTITKKYTLGKSKNNRTVSILLKDRNTRKQIQHEHKELKRKSIKDMKKYLRDHNIIRIGSNSPNEVIRQMYESSILAGDIVNHNKDTLLHNLSMNEDE
jgi:hypothetical protein